jgi:hypothetical protein
MNSVNWNTVWTAIGALAALAALCPFIRPILRRKRRRIRVFLTMQMSQLSASDYVGVRADIMELVYQLRRKTYDVYFFNEFVPRIEEFDEKEVNPEEYLGHIERSDYFIAIIPQRLFSSIYFEAGYALAHEKRSVYFIIQDNVMPILMRLVAADHVNVKIVKADALDEIPVRITNFLENARNSTT